MANSTESTNGSKPSESLHDKATRRWVGLRLLENMVLQKDQKAVLDESNRVVKWWHDHNMRAPKSGQQDGGDDMGDMIAGDQIINHHHHAKPASKLGWLAKAAVAAGLIASGAGIGACVPLVLDLLKPAPVVAPGEDTDSDTSLELNFWDK